MPANSRKNMALALQLTVVASVHIGILLITSSLLLITTALGLPLDIQVRC